MSRRTVEFRRKVDQITGSIYNQRIREAGGGDLSKVKRPTGSEVRDEVAKKIVTCRKHQKMLHLFCGS